MTDIVSLAIPFIALIFFIGMGENLVQFLENLFNREFHSGIGFFIIFLIFFGITFSGDWAFFSYFSIEFTPYWIDYIMSSVVVAAGSKFLEKKFNIINTIPSIITGIRVERAFSKAEKEELEKEAKETVEENDFPFHY